MIMTKSLFEYLAENPALFSLFITITLSPSVWRDRQSAEGLGHRVILLEELWTAMGYDFRYFLVPEAHPRSGAIHLHGLMAGLPEEELCAFDANTRLPPYILSRVQKGVEIYHSPTVERLFGYNVIAPITDMKRLAAYMTKHIGVCEEPPYGYCYLFSKGLPPMRSDPRG